MLYLNKENILELVSFDELMDAIELSFRIYESQDFEMPSRIHVDYNNKTLLYMPCFLKDIFGTKILTVFPENQAKKKPVIDGFMLLNDYETGEPIAMMDGKALTSLRTGAVGGVGIRHTTKETVKTVGLIGAGVQGFYQLLYACEARKIEKITIFDLFSEKLESFIKKLKKELPHVEITMANSVEELIEKSEVIITATTANQPVLPENPELLKGKHFVGIGSYKPTMREYPEALFSLLDKIYVDVDFAKEESGDLVFPLKNQLIEENQIETLGKFLKEEENKEEVVKKTTFFKSVGMGLFDIVVAQFIYNKAKDHNIGQKIIL